MRVLNIAIHLTHSDVNTLADNSYELTHENAQRALAEIGQTICGATCFLEAEDGTCREGALFYNPLVSAERVIVTLTPRQIES